jgi:hypothetical protein
MAAFTSGIHYFWLNFSDDSTKSIFTSEKCFTDPKLYHAHCITITIGYLVFDFLLTAVFVKDYTTFGMQTYFHHFAATIGFFMSLILNTHGAFILTCMGNQFTEISTPFMHIRQMLYIHKGIPYHGKIEIINIIMFLLTFLIGRMIF